MEAPSAKHANDPLWVVYAGMIGDLYENVGMVRLEHEVVSSEEIKSIGDVPEQSRDDLPWHHPNAKPKDDQVTLRDRLDAVDNGGWAALRIERLEIDREIAAREIEQLKTLIAPKN